MNQAWNSNIGFPKGSHPFGQVKGWQPLWGVGQSPTYSLKTLRKGWIQKQSGGLFLERGRPAREGVPLIKYDFFDKLRDALNSVPFHDSTNLYHCQQRLLKKSRQQHLLLKNIKKRRRRTFWGQGGCYLPCRGWMRGTASPWQSSKASAAMLYGRFAITMSYHKKVNAVALYIAPIALDMGFI